MAIDSREMEYALIMAEAVFNAGRWDGEELFADLPSSLRASMTNEYLEIAKAVIVKADKELKEAKEKSYQEGVSVGWIAGVTDENRAR